MSAVSLRSHVCIFMAVVATAFCEQKKTILSFPELSTHSYLGQNFTWFLDALMILVITFSKPTLLPNLSLLIRRWYFYLFSRNIDFFRSIFRKNRFSTKLIFRGRATLSSSQVNVLMIEKTTPSWYTYHLVSWNVVLRKSFPWSFNLSLFDASMTLLEVVVN